MCADGRERPVRSPSLTLRIALWRCLPRSAALLTIVACGDNLHPAESPDAPIAVDAPIFVDAAPPELDATPVIRDLMIQVASTGNDANNGVTAPVATLKRAIAIASSDPRVAGIAFASGRYTADTGETFPYLVPSELVLAGPSTGGAVLVGNKDTGLTVTRATLRNLELESFTTALTVTGALRAEDLKVRGSAIAVRGEAASTTVVNHLEITGIPASCTASIVLTGAADLTVTTLATTDVSTVLDAADTSAVQITDGVLPGNRSCPGAALVKASTNGVISLTNSRLSDSEVGIEVPATAHPRLLLTNTIVHNGVYGVRGAPATFHMTGGAITRHTEAGASGTGGAWSFSDVVFKFNVVGLQLQSNVTDPATTLTLRRSSITDNRVRGIKLVGFVVADLGTVATPGENTIALNGVGVELDGMGGHLVNAVGNHWSPNIQDANAVGDYAEVKVVSGPIKAPVGTAPPLTANFALADEWSIRR